MELSAKAKFSKLQVSLLVEDHVKLKQVAREQGFTLQNYVRTLVKDHIEKYFAEPLGEHTFWTKEEAVATVARMGFTDHVSTSESGDWGPGSREYYAKPGAEKNEHGMPLRVKTVSMMGINRWLVH